MMTNQPQARAHTLHTLIVEMEKVLSHAFSLMFSLRRRFRQKEKYSAHTHTHTHEMLGKIYFVSSLDIISINSRHAAN